MRFLTGRQSELVYSAGELKKILIEDRVKSIPQNTLTVSPGKQQLIKRNTENWVRTWVDMEHKTVHSDGKRLARRAITEAGQLIWMVETPGRKYAFHADTLTPENAFLQAEQARLARRGIARRWNDVKLLRRRVLLGSIRLNASLEDARNAGLCELGIQGFLNRIGYAGATQVSGRLLMLISFFDRQVAYAVYTAHVRMQGEH